MKTHYTSRPITGLTELDLGDGRVLRIDTKSKPGLGLVTSASVLIDEGGGTLTHRLCGDFSKVLVMQLKMATRNAVLEQHTSVLADLDALKSEIARFYQSKQAAQEGQRQSGPEESAWN